MWWGTDSVLKIRPGVHCSALSMVICNGVVTCHTFTSPFTKIEVVCLVRLVTLFFSKSPGSFFLGHPVSNGMLSRHMVSATISGGGSDGCISRNRCKTRGSSASWTPVDTSWRHAFETAFRPTKVVMRSAHSSFCRGPPPKALLGGSPPVPPTGMRLPTIPPPAALGSWKLCF